MWVFFKYFIVVIDLIGRGHHVLPWQ